MASATRQRPSPAKRMAANASGSLFKRQRMQAKNKANAALAPTVTNSKPSVVALSAKPDLKYIFSNGGTLWMSVRQSQMPPNSVLMSMCRRADPRKPIDLTHFAAVCDNEVFYTLFNCLAQTYDKEGGPQFLAVDDANKLRDACTALQLDFDTVVRPYFHTPAEYERCVFTLAHPDACGQLSFVNGKALLTFISMSTKYAGLFAYTFDTSALRLRNVRQHASLRFAFDDNDLIMHLNTVTRQHQYRFVNRTPEALRRAPALPSYFDR